MQDVTCARSMNVCQPTVVTLNGNCSRWEVEILGRLRKPIVNSSTIDVEGLFMADLCPMVIGRTRPQRSVILPYS